jgi:uncharacterized protein (DUF2336 family)
MQEQMNSQGEIPGGGAARKSVSADSFRRLTALLKKPMDVHVPELKPVFAAPAAQVDIAPVVSTVAEIFVSPEIMVEPISPVIKPMIVAEPIQALIEPIILAEPIQAMIEPMIIAEPVQAMIEPLIAVEPVNEIAVSTVFAEPISAVIEPVIYQAEAPVAALPEFVLPLEAAPEPAPPKRRLLRKNKVDAFALVPEQFGAKPVAQVESFTPAQESEATELARSLLDMMAASSSGGQPQERALAADTLLRMLPRLPTRAKITLAERLCIMEAPPPFLISKLIGDADTEVAGPLLEDCSHIPDEDLFQVIESGDPIKRRMMARRRKISRPIAESLAKTGDESVALTLARNQGAEIPQEGFDAIAKMVPDNPDLLAPLCTRQDLPVHFAFELFWLAPAQLRRYLLSRFLTDSELLTKILKITMDANGEEHSPDADDEAIIAALNLPSEERIEFFAVATKINTATVEKIMADDQGEPLMALIKVAGLPRSQLQEIMPSLIKGEAPLIDPERNLDEVQAVFDQLSFNKARILLTYWDWATLRMGPYGAFN